MPQARVCGGKVGPAGWRRTLPRAYAHPGGADAKRALQWYERELRLRHYSAAESRRDGPEATVTLHRLAICPEPGTSFETTNLIGHVMAREEANAWQLAIVTTDNAAA